MEICAAGVLEQAPGRVAQMRAVDVFVARPQQPGAAELDQRALGVVVDAVRDGAHADLARVGRISSDRGSTPIASVSSWSCELK